ncbi:MAG: hypothetical protein ACFFCO_07645 [Promethearchaeota archaeon]
MTVHAVWVIDASGIPLFHKAYSPLEFDPTLFSSFFSAIVHFQSELMGRQLQDIAFENLSFTYVVDAGLVFLACVKKDFQYSNLLSALRDLFYRHFRENLILLSMPLRGSPEARTLLRRFEQDVDVLVGFEPQKEPLPVRVTSLERLLYEESPIRKDIEERFGVDGIFVILLSDGKHTAGKIAEALKISLTRLEEILQYAGERGYVKVAFTHQVDASSAKLLTSKS